MTQQTSSSSIRTLLLALAIAIPLHAGTALADCGVDIVCLVNEMAADVKKFEKDASSLANDVIPPVQKTLKNVENGVKQVQTDFTDLSDGSTHIVKQFKETLDSLTSVNSLDGFFGYSEGLVSRLTEGMKYVNQEIENEGAEYQKFVGTSGCTAVCQDFRQRTANMIVRIGSTTDLTTDFVSKLLGSVTGAPPSFARRVDTQSLADRIEGAPGLALFPLYVLLNDSRSASSIAPEPWEFQGRPWSLPESVSASCTGENYCSFFNMVDAVLDQISSNVSALDAASRAKVVAQAPFQNCESIGVDTSVTPLAYGLFAFGEIYLIVGSILESAGLAGLDLSIAPGVDEGPAVEAAFKKRPARQAAHILRMIGNPAARAGAFLLVRKRDCSVRLDERMVMCALQSGQKNFRDDCRTRVLNGEAFGF